MMTAQEASETLLNTVCTLEPLIRQHADEAESTRRLSPSVVRALMEAGLFRMCVPRALGGLEVAPLTFYRVVEAVARLDGSTGWCAFIGGAGGLVGAYLANHTAEAILVGTPSRSWPALSLRQGGPRSRRAGISSAGAGRMRAAVSTAPGCLDCATCSTRASRA